MGREAGEEPREDARAGLCARCAHHRVQTSARGSRFHRCLRGDRDPAYPKYPPLPVRECRGYAPQGEGEPGVG